MVGEEGQGCKKYVLSKILKFFVIDCLNPPLAGRRINYANILSHFTINITQLGLLIKCGAFSQIFVKSYVKLLLIQTELSK